MLLSLLVCIAGGLFLVVRSGFDLNENREFMHTHHLAIGILLLCTALFIGHMMAHHSERQTNVIETGQEKSSGS